MKRSISDEEYSKIVNSNQLALNTDTLIRNKRIIFEFTYWVVTENKYPYLEYDGLKVLKHLLIIPKDDGVLTFYDLKVEELQELRQVIKFITQQYYDTSNNVINYMWKEKGKSINKFHIHFLFLEE